MWSVLRSMIVNACKCYILELYITLTVVDKLSNYSKLFALRHLRLK